MPEDKINLPVIDAVILWVDGDDPKHRKKILCHTEDDQFDQSREFRDRFAQINEIKFTVNSLLKFAPYLRKIHLITDNQIPDFLTVDSDKGIYKKVSVVDHKVIFDGYQQYLPTFNCRSIDTCMHRTPDLAENFIYLNDDFFLTNPTQPEDFFRNSLPVFRGKWLKFDRDIFIKRFKKTRKGHKLAQQRAAELIGFNKYFRFFHTPHPLRKSTIENFFKVHQGYFLENIRYKFRDENQFALQALANHIEIKNKTCFIERD